MSTIIGTFAAFAFFDMPWTALIIAGFLLVDAFEIWIWLRWRKRRSITGVEGLVGEQGRAISDLSPDGQVRVRGQLWKAHSKEQVDAGARVEVLSARGLRLEVRPLRNPTPTLPSQSP